MGVAQVFVGKIFVHRLQTTKSTKILSLEYYPLYGSGYRYQNCYNNSKRNSVPFDINLKLGSIIPTYQSSSELEVKVQRVSIMHHYSIVLVAMETKFEGTSIRNQQITLQVETQ